MLSCKWFQQIQFNEQTSQTDQPKDFHASFRVSGIYGLTDVSIWCAPFTSVADRLNAGSTCGTDERTPVANAAYYSEATAADDGVILSP